MALQQSPDSKRLREVTARIEQIGTQAGRLMWELGGLLTEVEQTELWRTTPHGGFLEWIDGAMKFSRQTARKYQQIHAHFSADMAERYGSEKLVAGLAYLAQTKREEEPGDLVATTIRVRTTEGTFASVPFPLASVRQIRQATLFLAGANRADEAPSAPAEAERVGRLTAALAAEGLSARVTVTGGRDGVARYAIQELSATEIGQVLALLQRHLLGESS